MLRSLLTNGILLDPAPIEGGGAPVVATPALAPMNTTPLKEGAMPASLAGTELSLEDSDVPTPTQAEIDKANGGEGKVTPKTAAEPAKAVEPAPKAVEPAKPALTLPTVKKAGEVKPEVVVPAAGAPVIPKGARDYSKFLPEDVARLKKMNNEDFAFWDKKLAPLYAAEKKAVELEAKVKAFESDPQAIPRDWYNHPAAYVLHPSYQKGYETFQKAQFEHEHAKAQLEKIENNEDWQLLKGYQPDGTPVFETRKADAGSKVAMMGQMNAASQVVNKIQGQLQQFEGGFKQRHEACVGYVNKVIEDKFPWHKDANDPRHKDAAMLMEATPEEFRSHPCAKVASLLWATVIEFARTNDELVAQLKTGKTLKEVQDEVEPNPSTVATTVAEPAQLVGGKGKPLTGMLDVDELNS